MSSIAHFNSLKIHHCLQALEVCFQARRTHELRLFAIFRPSLLFSSNFFDLPRRDMWVKFKHLGDQYGAAYRLDFLGKETVVISTIEVKDVASTDESFAYLLLEKELQ